MRSGQLPRIALFLGALISLVLVVIVTVSPPAARSNQGRSALRPALPSKDDLPTGIQTPQLPDAVRYAPVVPVSIDLARLPQADNVGNSKYERWLRGELGEPEYRIDPARKATLVAQAFQLQPDDRAQQVLSQTVPLLGSSFDALDVNDCCGGGATVPPDPELAAGPNHLIAVVNVALEIYDKSGTSLLGPITLSTLFNSLPGGNCTGSGPFDPNTLYDESADRFIVASDGNGKAYCVAVSKSGDPTGSWWLYEFATNVGGNFFDFPHAGIGLDAIYLGANMFAGNTFAEGRIWAFDKAALYAGQPVAAVSRSTGSDGTPMPLSLHGFSQGTWPSSGPHMVLTDGQFDGAVYRLYSWTEPFDADILGPGIDLDLGAFHGVQVGMPVNNIQAGSGGAIAGNDFRVLDFEYRNGSGWTTMDVSCNPGGGTVNCVQWGEIDLASGSLLQAGIFATEGDYRYFPDLAANHCGDVAIGYSKSSASTFPSIWATGRRSGDSLGLLGNEIEIKAGEISYAAFDLNRAPVGVQRWGDYSGMTIDPDGTTFWYLGEYSKNVANTGAKWGTFIGSVSFPECVLTPDFNLRAVPAVQAICLPDDALYRIEVGSLLSFDEPVTLSAAGVPEGMQAAFAANPVVPAASSDLTLSVTSAPAPGAYTLTISGTASTVSKSTQVGLTLVEGPPEAGELLMPADSASSVPLSPTFQWNGGAGVSSYLLEVASDAQFAQIVYSATVFSDAHIASIELASASRFYWRVTGSNTCGEGTPSLVSSFTTANYLCSSPGVSIPDQDSSGVSDVLTVTHPGRISDLNLYLDVSHTWIGDLKATLTHETSNTQITLFDRPGVPNPSDYGCGGDNIDALLDDEGLDGNAETNCGDSPALAGQLLPVPGPLSAFDDELLEGRWRLTISDSAASDVGVLNRWCLNPEVVANTESVLYLPVIMNESLLAPDLVVLDAQFGAAIEITIQNQGNAIVYDDFWVDLYVDPSPLPTAVNQVWMDLAEQGMVWGITRTVAAGEIITLTYSGEPGAPNLFFQPEMSRISEVISPGTPIYIQVDSANNNSNYGAVLEKHEIEGAAYNNVFKILSE